MKTLLCSIGRQENQYIREFIEYNKAVGFTNVCLYDNNRDGEDDFHDVIGDYIDSGYVILKDYRNREACQLGAYAECYKEYGNEYDWIAFFDCDEFLTFTKAKNIEEFLSDECFKDFEAVHLNWLCYGDGGICTNDGGGVIERIKTPVLPVDKHIGYNFPENFHIKTILRGGLGIIKWYNPHLPLNEKDKAFKGCDCVGASAEVHYAFLPYNYKGAYLRHYSTKTAEEYCNKMKKGFPDRKWDMDKEGQFLIETRFFRYNEVTEEKVKMFKDKLGVDLSYLLPSNIEKSTDTKIYSLCYSKKDFDFLDDKVVTPLQVGAANNTGICWLKDNTGENISHFNYFFIENTGTYWIWKNVKDAKYKGQMQYRRPLKGVDETMNFDEMFEKYDVITCEPFHHPDHKVPTKEEPMVISADTVEQGYAFSNCIDDLYILEMAVKMYYPEYSNDWDKYIKNGPDLYYSNGFVMKSEDFDKYAEFSYKCLNYYLELANIHSEKDLMEHVKYNIEVGKYVRYGDPSRVPPEAIKWQSEIGGFLSERLWTLWVQHNFQQEKIYKTPYIKMEEGMYT